MIKCVQLSLFPPLSIVYFAKFENQFICFFWQIERKLNIQIENQK